MKSLLEFQPELIIKHTQPTADHCPDPGTPPGATREGHIFNIDDKVTYTCSKNLKLIGSKVRVCQDGGYWSGKEPECYGEHPHSSTDTRVHSEVLQHRNTVIQGSCLICLMSAWWYLI